LWDVRGALDVQARVAVRRAIDRAGDDQMARQVVDRSVAIVDGCRTPFARAGTVFRSMSPVELGTLAVRELLYRAELDPAAVDEIVYGVVVPPVQAPNVAREVGLAAGVPPSVPAYSVSRACASANQAITSAAEAISRGYADIMIAGGVEVLSDIPMLLSRRLRDALVGASKAKTVGGRLRALAGVRPRDFAPVAPAIAEPSTGETMGQSAERMAKENGISREAQDRWALRSHRLAQRGTGDGRLKEEIIPVFVPPTYEPVVTRDNGIREDTSLEKLAALPPVFDRKYGTVSAGNASPLTDGASAVLLMSEERAKAMGYEPLGYIRSWAYAALSPAAQLLQGPAYAAPRALDRAGVAMADIELWEMHEAFAAQVLSNLQALDSDEFARRELGRDRKVGILDEDRINVMGGSIAIGHPFGATGGRLTITLLREMRRRDLGLGLITVCAAGALGFAMVVERR
jgi:acetyl-CoA acyltransferase